jgi:hypothetical protein
MERKHATHFIEQYCTIDGFIPKFYFSSIQSISNLEHTLRETRNRHTLKTVAIFFLTPKTKI